MKRRAFRICAFLLLLVVGGAIVNAAVAWGCAICVPEPRAATTAQSFEVRKDVSWMVDHSRSVGSEIVSSWVSTVLTFGGDDRWQPQTNQQLPVFPNWWKETRDAPEWGQNLCDVARGWPMRSLFAKFRGDGKRPGLFTDFRQGGIVLARARAADHLQVALPFLPIWPGFAINTMFYAAILWMLFAAPFAIRRRRRIKHGLCPACAYPVGTNDKCTECGAAVRAQPQRGASTSAQGNALGNGHATTPEP